MSNSITKRTTTTTSTLVLKDNSNTTNNHNSIMSTATNTSATNANKPNSVNLKNNVNTTAGTVLMLNRKQFTPTTDTCNASFSSASVAGSIQDDMSDQCSLTQAGLEEYNIRASSYYDQPVLFHHQKQSSYAQSEGYHSYVSSSDSSSATPFLDRLRQESDLLSRQSHHWSQNDLSSVSGSSVAPSPTPLLLNTKHERSANEDVDTHHLSHQQQNNSSESTSSTETLKWLGSMSDVSEASHATGYSAISESVSSSQLIVHSSRVLTPKRHHSESVLYLNNDHQQQHSPNSQSPKQQQHNSKVSPTLSAREHHSPVQLISNHRHSPSYPPVHTTQTIQPYQKQLIPMKRDLNTIDLPKSSLVAATDSISSTATTKLVTVTPTTIAPTVIQTQPLESQQHKSNISVTISNSEAVVTISPQPPASSLVKCDTVSTSDKSITSNTGTKTATTTSPQSPLSDTHVSIANVSSTSSTTTPITAAVVTAGAALTATSYRSNHRLFPVSTYTEPIHSNTSHYVHHPKPQYSANLQKPSANNSTLNTTATNADGVIQTKQAQNSPPANWQSVAERINDFERGGEISEPQKYTFIDPSKTHRISNPALKAFQKNAVQSYFERQQQQQNQQNHLQPQTQSQDNNQQKIYQPHPSHHHLQQQQLLRPHSYQPAASIKDAVGQQALRNSLPNTYGGNVALTNSTRNSITTSTKMPTMSQKSVSSDSLAYTANVLNTSPNAKPPSPAPPPPPPRSRSLMATTLLRRSSSASDYAEFRDQFTTASQEKLQSQSIKNISNAEKMSFNDCGMPPPPPPPRARAPITSRRTSSASEYAAMRDKVLLQHAAAIAHQQHHPHQHQHSKAPRTPNLYTSPPQSSHGVLIAPHDDWVPERPPKNPNLRIPSPDLPPPPADIDTSLSDEPLPPPPPEILHRQTSYFEIENIAPLSGNDSLASAISPNRRNSFAGSSTRKLYNNRSTGSTHDMHIKAAPPLIPKKPTNIEILQVSRPTASLVQQSNKAHKVLLNGGSHMHQTQLQTTKLPQASKITSRKRPHNPALITVPPILENQTMTSPVNLSPTSMNLSSNNFNKSSPPPLMPRLLIPNQAPAMLINSKQRCNSKASYLPRQSLEKLNNTDPDHGSYKLTLTSNEDLVANIKPTYDILNHNGKITNNNLPDVLPLGAKLQPQPSSPTSANNNSPLRYGSNNNLALSTTSPTIQQQQQHAASCYSIYPPTHHRYSSPAVSSYNNNNNNATVPSYARSQSYDVNTNVTSPNKFMSQSTLDLKRMPNLETTLEEVLPESTNIILSPAQSENNLSSPKISNTSITSYSPRTSTKESEHFDLSNNRGNLENVTEAEDGRIFRAELVNTTLSTSPCGTSNKIVTRKDSLRENIEKITQLQSQLMSAHMSDNSLLGSYSVKTNTQNTTKITLLEKQSALTKEAEHITEIKELNNVPCTQSNANEKSTCVTEPINNSPNNKQSDITAPLLPLTQPPVIEFEQNQDLQNIATNMTEDTVAAAQISQMDSSTDGLKLMQRSEIVLRVNPSTTEAASQTDDLPDSDMGRLTTLAHTKEDTATHTTLQPRQRHPIEIDCENLSKELASLLQPNDKLIEVLMPQSPKLPTDYVGNLYNPNVALRPTKRNVGTSTLMRMKTRDSQETSDKQNIVTLELQFAELEVTLANSSENDSCDLMKNKVIELICHLKRKIRILTNEQTTISEESAINDELGSSLISKVADKVRPIESTKFRTYIDDVGHITSLLLSLSERLARIENSLLTTTEQCTEKKILESKRERLLEQLTEAKRLREDIQRRGTSVMGMLEKNLSVDEYADFDYFINMKAKLIADARDIADKIKFGEEQMTALSEMLIQSDC